MSLKDCLSFKKIIGEKNVESSTGKYVFIICCCIKVVAKFRIKNKHLLAHNFFGWKFKHRLTVFLHALIKICSLIFIFYFFLVFSDVDHFWSAYWIYYNIVSILCFVFMARRHMGSQLKNQGLNQDPLRWKAKS